MASVAAAVVSLFPEIQPVAPEEMFSSTVDAARAEYNEYYAVYKEAADRIASLAKEWEKRHTLVIAGKVNPPLSADQETAELNQKVDTYIEFRQVREDTKRILDVYKEAIKELQTPVLDPNTLRVFQRAGVKMTDLRTPFDQVFTADVTLLRTQMVLIDEMYKTIVHDLESLRTALEPLGVHSLRYTWISHSSLKVYEKSLTPIVKSLVREREKALALVPNPVE